MSSFERLKGKLQRRLSDDGFYDDNFAEIEQLCKKYLENETTEDPQYARRETGIYLLYHLIGDLRALWDAEQPFLQDRRDALRNGTWGPFRDFARAVIAEAELEDPFQAALRSILLLVDS